MSAHILGLSAFGHGSAAALLRDGEIVAAAQEERFTRRKFDSGFPAAAARFCLDEGGVRLAEVDHVAFHGRAAARSADDELRRALHGLAGDDAEPPPLLIVERDRSHAGSAFFPSPLPRAATLCVGGAGERVPTSAWLGEDGRLSALWQIAAPHSLGLLYSAFTGYCGFQAGADEYKLMGLAPYGEDRYADLVRERLLDIGDDGDFRLDMAYFDAAGGEAKANAQFHALFGGPPREPEGAIEQRHMDLARSVQVVTEEVLLRLARRLRRETGAESLCLAGEVALNCVAAGRLLREGPFRDVWIQPAAGDAGGALGAALYVWHEELHEPRIATASAADAMRGGFLGPAYDDAAVEAALREAGAVWRRLNDEALFARVAALLAQGNVVGWMQGRMEFGPRALGARSILGDPRDPGMQSLINHKIKFRESFRPFAPAVLAERAHEYFVHDRPSPFMSFAVPVAAAALATLPAVTHVDGSARIQTVDAQSNPRFRRLLEAFEAATGCAVLVNTSFNVRGEPIVCTPADAWRCFMRTALDYLVVGNCLLAKGEQRSRGIGAAPPGRRSVVPGEVDVEDKAQGESERRPRT